MTFGLDTGMRLGEILSLGWKGVDLFMRTVTVFKSKNKEPRTTPINQRVFEILKNKVRVKSIKTNLVFYPSNHTMILKTSIDHAFQTALKRAGIKDFRFHDLRHTAATRMVQAGKDLNKIQRPLGHKIPAMTQRYAHHYPESLRDAVEVLDKISTNLPQSGKQEVN